MMDIQENESNKVLLTGTIDSEASFSHETYGERFYESIIKVKRLSEQYDYIPITIPEIDLGRVCVGHRVSIEGYFRSYNKIINERSKLILSVFIKKISDAMTEVDENSIELKGYICKPTVYRTTPFSREICDMLIAANRAYNKSDYIPCIAWGRNARYMREVDIGQKVIASGRIQSRNYFKVVDGISESRVAYEVSINKIQIKD